MCPFSCLFNSVPLVDFNMPVSVFVHDAVKQSLACLCFTRGLVQLTCKLFLIVAQKSDY